MKKPTAPHWNSQHARIYCGDSLAILREIPTASVHAIVTDPPYSSGGLHRSDRNLKTSDKYVMGGTDIDRPEFHGDNRDQRSFTYWCSLWMAECLRITRPGGYLMTFSDWRQVPAMSDAIQAGGWIWRGQVVWDKTEASRPQKGWFRTGQSEFVLLASHGPMTQEQNRIGACHAGVWRGSVQAAEKQHITGKPMNLMKWLLGVLPADATILDPFAGSGTTLLAAQELGLQSIGIEISPVYCEIIRRRLSQETLPLAECTP